MNKKNIAVFASGNGSNLQAIINAQKKGYIKAKIALLVCDNPGAFALSRANQAKIPIALLAPNDFSSRLAYEQCLVKILKKFKIDLIVLAGFMRMLSPYFVKSFKNKIINIHPALLPAFKGTQGIKDALNYGVKITGVTVHFVDEKMDHGAIILQQEVTIKSSDTEKSLAARIHAVEHRIYPQACKLFLGKRLKISGRRVKII